MEEIIACPQCHTSVRPTDYYCYNCGKNFRSAPPDTSVLTLAGFLVGAVVLPPMGIIWGFRYIRHPVVGVKLFGWLLIALTIIELVIIARVTIDLYNTVNNQVINQMQNLQGL